MCRWNCCNTVGLGKQPVIEVEDTLERTGRWGGTNMACVMLNDYHENGSAQSNSHEVTVPNHKSRGLFSVQNGRYPITPILATQSKCFGMDRTNRVMQCYNRSPNGD